MLKSLRKALIHVLISLFVVLYKNIDILNFCVQTFAVPKIKVFDSHKHTANKSHITSTVLQRPSLLLDGIL